MKIPLEFIRSLHAIKSMINSVPFDEIEWTENGETLVFPEEVTTFYCCTGLNNFDFPKYGTDDALVVLAASKKRKKLGEK